MIDAYSRLNGDCIITRRKKEFKHFLFGNLKQKYDKAVHGCTPQNSTLARKAELLPVRVPYFYVRVVGIEFLTCASCFRREIENSVAGVQKTIYIALGRPTRGMMGKHGRVKHSCRRTMLDERFMFAHGTVEQREARENTTADALTMFPEAKHCVVAKPIPFSVAVADNNSARARAPVINERVAVCLSRARTPLTRYRPE
jgi:hypothetical protein